MHRSSRDRVDLRVGVGNVRYRTIGRQLPRRSVRSMHGQARCFLRAAQNRRPAEIAGFTTWQPGAIGVVTSYALSGDEDKARAAGADDYITKPYSPRQLLAKVNEHLR